MRIKKGDIVVIRRGKDRGAGDKPRTGKVLHVFTKNNRLIVESINMINRHTRPTRTNPAPMFLSTVNHAMLRPKSAIRLLMKVKELKQKSVSAGNAVKQFSG